MTELIQIELYNDVHIRIHCSPGVACEIAERFTFVVNGFQFMPKFKQGKWDGKIRLFNPRLCLLYAGLTFEVENFAREFGYDIEYLYDHAADEFSALDAVEYIKKLHMPDHIELRDYQVNTFTHAVRNRRALYLSPTSCHGAGDRVLMADGLWKNIEDIQFGDFVIGSDGKIKEVLRTFSGEDELFEIKPKGNKKSITVTGEHVLSLKFSDYSKINGYGKGDKNYIENISVNEYITKSKTYKHCSNLYYNDIPLNFVNSVDPKINLTPYFIGLYIGDGSANSCQMTTADDEILSETIHQANVLNMNVRKKGKYCYCITGSENKRNKIFKEFDKIGIRFGTSEYRIRCNERFIPDSLLKASLNFRLELLAGLIDSDGYLANKTAFEFVSKSERLSKNVSDLANSLGLITSSKIKFNKKYNTNYYKITIMGNIETIPTRIPRKIALNFKRFRDPYHAKFDIINKGKNKYYGIEVQDHLYITNDGMVTHNSGKSLIIYFITRMMLTLRRKTLIVVPSTNLIHQLASDFKEYGFDSDTFIHKIHDGKEVSKKPVTITTWQSVYKLDKEWFANFDAIIVDEAHLAAAKSLIGIMEKCVNIPYRFGLTGTTDEAKESSELTLQGLFGKKKNVTTTYKLMEDGHVAQLTIKAIVLKHPPERCKLLRPTVNGKTVRSKEDYAREIDLLIGCESRNRFIKNLALSLKGNTMILYSRVAKHGEVLHDMFLKENLVGRNVYFVAGSGERKMSGEERDALRAIVEKENNAIIIASYGTLSTGYSIKNLSNVIFASPRKTKIGNIQSIGRALRVNETKKNATVFDIADDLSHGKNKNITLLHFIERMKLYAKEKFKSKNYLVQIK
ncbi:MAG: Hint domain-containing homing endonuclease [Legionella sp.]|uniref:DEAD/DEAH box helicase family protein n=1 Tax=Legionella sp. TaxID=459 RepID=UPI00284807AF|nr:Hint domain-containing homing endonuclease [Legionella sp.]